MRITMVGTGYVGLVTGTCLANTGNDVVCLDIDSRKIEMLRAGRSPIYEPGLQELIRRNVDGGRLHFTTDKALAYQSSEIIFICVGTPSDKMGRTDLRCILEAAGDIGDAIEIDSGPMGGDLEDRRAKIIVVKSTVPVGTNAKLHNIINDRTNKPFRMASNPEFLKEGAAIGDFNKPDRVVIGTDHEGTAQRLQDLYEPFVRQGNPIYIMDIASAEMVKYASNAMLATKISFINEIANLCEAFGADINQVRLGMCSDQRIGNQFLYPGLGYGGSCFPKDVLACLAMGQQTQSSTHLLAAVHEVNQQQRQTFIRKIEQHFEAIGHGGLESATIAIWGIAFKPGTDDVREAPSITVLQYLIDQQANIMAYDPVAMVNCQQLLGNRIRYADDPLSALDGADALIVCTDWDEFKHPDFDAMRQRMRHPVIFDGRNIYRRGTMREHGFVYYSVGRRPVAPDAMPTV